MRIILSTKQVIEVSSVEIFADNEDIYIRSSDRSIEADTKIKKGTSLIINEHPQYPNYEFYKPKD